jgi:signal transduction histidine kinase
MLRHAASASDKANAEAIEVAVLQAKAEAESRERQRLDALIHDSVLTALISATNAKTIQEATSAAELASIALEKLAKLENNSLDDSPVFCGDLFESITSAARRLDPELETRKDCQSQVLVNQEVSSALTEAILQGLQNSQLHAGPKVKRELILKSINNELKLVLKDNGKGFRPNRVPRGRLGIKNSIIARVQNVGGEVHIVSSPGQGAAVILEWSSK